jgi:hypothetical protein
VVFLLRLAEEADAQDLPPQQFSPRKAIRPFIPAKFAE